MPSQKKSQKRKKKGSAARGPPVKKEKKAVRKVLRGSCKKCTRQWSTYTSALACVPQDPEPPAYDPKDNTQPIPLEYKLWAFKNVSNMEGLALPAVVIEKRKREQSAPDSSSAAEQPTHRYDYYVHFEGQDRRMDQWVSYEQIRFTGAARPGTDHEDHHGFDAKSLREHNEATKVRTVEEIQIGPHVMKTWYFSPFPAEYCKHKKLYFCEFCLTFFGGADELRRHGKHCTWTHPPGNEIYRSKDQHIEVAMFEVDGKKEIQYVENICYIAKLFLDHKLIFWDTHPFLFYVLCEVTPRGCSIVGYFSKEKVSATNNLACILTLPCHQKKGFGKFLISMSYELSKKEGRSGTPETPISDLGQKAYNSYWRSTILDILSDAKYTDLSVTQISKMTSMTLQHVQVTLEKLNVLKYDSAAGYSLQVPASLIKAHAEWKRKRSADKTRQSVRLADPRKIRFTPFFARKIWKKKPSD